MFFLTWIVTFLLKAYRKVSKVIVLAGYDPFTICKYFRKQGAKIGEDCCISIKSLGSEPYLVTLGNHVFIASNAVLHTHDGGVYVLRDTQPDLEVFGPIIIEDNCIIGVGAQLLPNIRIGKNSIVGAGSVVISDVPPDSIVMGVPARRISAFSKYKEKCFAQWEVQRPPGSATNKKGPDESKKALKIKRKHLTELFMNQAEKEEQDPEE